jgi:hypothetical protein
MADENGGEAREDRDECPGGQQSAYGEIADERWVGSPLIRRVAWPRVFE